MQVIAELASENTKRSRRKTKGKWAVLLLTSRYSFMMVMVR
jgi:hypothetical protein